MKFQLNKNVKTYLPNLYGFLFIFTSICRQFLFAGVLDLRYITFILGGIMVTGHLLMNYKSVLVVEKRKLYLISYFLLAIFSNIRWLFNGISINEEGFWKLVILFAFNICGIIVFSLYREFYNTKRIWKWILISCSVLVISMYLAYIGIDMKTIWGTKLKGVNIIDNTTNLTRNMLRVGIRAAGYAEDPNYATLFLILGIVAAFTCCHGKIRYIFLIFLGGGILIANSNTVVISTVLSIVITILVVRINKSEKFIYSLLFCGIITMIVVLPLTRAGDSLLTLNSRYDMWINAMHLFLDSPLIGNGWTSFRSIHLWYVHCHNTYWEILCENGILAFSCYLLYYYKTLLTANSMQIKFLLLCYCIYSMMFDMSYMQIGVVILCLLPEVDIYGEEKNIVFC